MRAGTPSSPPSIPTPFEPGKGDFARKELDGTFELKGDAPAQRSTSGTAQTSSSTQGSQGSTLQAMPVQAVLGTVLVAKKSPAEEQRDRAQAAASARNAARSARDGARHPAGPPVPSAPAAAFDLNQLVSYATPATVSSSWTVDANGAEAKVDIALTTKAAVVRLLDRDFPTTAFGGSLSAKAALKISWQGATAGALHDWGCKRCGESGWNLLGACGDWRNGQTHDPGCKRCGSGCSADLRDAWCVWPSPGTPTLAPTFTLSCGSLSSPSEQAVRDLAHRLFVELSPTELKTWLPQLPELIAQAYRAAIRHAFDQLRSAFPNTGDFQGSFDGAFDRAREDLIRKFDDAATATSERAIKKLHERLLNALQLFAAGQLDKLNELFSRIVEFLHVFGLDVRPLVELAGDALRRALAAGTHEANSLWNHVDWLVGFAFKLDLQTARWLLATLLAATKDHWEAHRTQVEILLEDDLLRLRNLNVLDFTRDILVLVRDAMADPQGSAKFLIELGIALAEATAEAARTDFPAVVGSFLGVFAGGYDRAGHDLGPILAALADRLAQVHPLTGDEVKVLLIHVGDDALFKRVLQWVHENWATFSKFITEKADELKQWIEFILGLLKQGASQAFPEYERLVEVLTWLQGLPDAVLKAPQLLGNARDQLDALAATLRGNVIGWLHDNAVRNQTTMAQFLKEFITEKNALVENLKRVQGSVLSIFGQVQADADQAADAYLAALHDLQQFEQRLWSIFFSGGAGEGPAVAFINVNGVVSEPPSVEGGSIETSPPSAVTDALKSGEPFVGALGCAIAPDASFIQIDAQQAKLVVPHPCDTSADFTPPTGPSLMPATPPLIPLSLPAPWDAAVAICHLPEFHVIDMRYHYPYGDLACYHVADLDNDGFVRDWEVQAVRAGVTRATRDPNWYTYALDLDGDGKITTDDLQLAIEQQSRYVNGLMYRVETAPLGFFVKFAPGVWMFTAFTDLTKESIPKGIQRRGFLSVADGQLLIPLLPGVNYPIRFHNEQRWFVDVFEGLAPIPGIAPLVGSTRMDSVLRGGKTGRDWQVYFTSEPANPILRTWNIRGRFYLSGAGSAGVAAGEGGAASAGGAGQGRGSIYFSYETTAPLVQVMMEWQDRFKHIAERSPGDLPVPWKFIQGLLEWTDVPRLVRALVQIAGPVTDVLFDWVDEGHHIRAALGYLRQYDLNQFSPAPSWEQLRAEVQAWEGPTPAQKTAIVQAIRDTQAELRVGDEDAVFAPFRIARRCRAAFADPAQPGKPLPEHAQVCAFLEKTFELESGRRRFAASLDQLVPTGPPPPGSKDRLPYKRRVRIPECGIFRVRNVFIAACPINFEDVKKSGGELAGKKWEPTVDEVLSVRGNPFYKPIYHTIVEFGPAAKLYAVPSQQPEFELGSVVSQKGVVEGSRVLEDLKGNRWLWVRTESWLHGWLFIDKVVCDRIFTTKEAAVVAGEDLAQSLGIAGVLSKATDALVQVVDPDKINFELDELTETLQRKKLRPTVVRIQASARSTVDESRHARLCRAAFARKAAGRATADDLELIARYQRLVEEFKLRMFGVGDEARSKTTADLALAFNKLSLTKREKLWAAGSAWYKLAEYVPMVGMDFISKVLPLLGMHKFEEAWQECLIRLGKAGDVELEELLITAQCSMPAFKEILCALVDIGLKIKGVVDDVKSGDFHNAGSATLNAANDPNAVTWNDLGLKLVRLLIDDEEEPGRTPVPKAQQRGSRKDHDSGITFSWDVTVKVEKEKDPPTPPPKNERKVYLAEPMVAKIDVIERPGADAPNADKRDLLEAKVSEWAAYVHADPPRYFLTPSSRVPDQFRKENVGWQYSVNGGPWQEVVDDDGKQVKGELLRFRLVPGVHNGSIVRFRAYTSANYDWSAASAAAATTESTPGGTPTSGEAAPQETRS